MLQHVAGDVEVRERRADARRVVTGNRRRADRTAEDRVVVVAGTGAGEERVVARTVEVPPALRGRAVHAIELERRAAAQLLLEVLLLLLQQEFVLAEVVGGLAGTGEAIRRISDERRDALIGEEFEVGVERAARAVEEMLARKDVVEIGGAIAERESIEVAFLRLDANRAGGAGAEVGRGDDDAIADHRIRRRQRKAADQESFALVDLRPVHAGAAFEIEPAIARFDVERIRLRVCGGGEDQEREESFDGHLRLLTSSTAGRGWSRARPRGTWCSSGSARARGCGTTVAASRGYCRRSANGIRGRAARCWRGSAGCGSTSRAVRGRSCSRRSRRRRAGRRTVRVFRCGS